MEQLLQRAIVSVQYQCLMFTLAIFIISADKLHGLPAGPMVLIASIASSKFALNGICKEAFTYGLFKQVSTQNGENMRPNTAIDHSSHL